ncbi:hypothetical protein [Aliagarivorans taiwanensis]|uniref:hypothetical protein n=1 Tax=Aliagarivorans taiwanensis TaxID=561966 RepID=UPI00040D0899|nr:hypothetical protein [Aliagarivorans taiwanensis]
MQYWFGAIACGLSLAYVANAEELLVNKVCPVSYERTAIGVLVFSQPWYHSSRYEASYTARDNATGVGLEIHLFANRAGELDLDNIAQCDQYRMLQVRNTNRTLSKGETASQIDAPANAREPFYDSANLEHGRGTHLTPQDDRDKPWQGRVERISTVGIYDTPYVTDAYGVSGEDIWVQFETCVVCQRRGDIDSIVGCGSWGYVREYLGGDDWSEPEFTGTQCLAQPTKQYRQALSSSQYHHYPYGEDWH